MIQHKWFRIEQGNDGSILSCTEVEAKGVKGGNVRFYSAIDQADACQLAVQWYRNKCEKDKAASANTRERLHAAGLCLKCRKTPKVDKSFCGSCRDKSNALRKQLRRGQRPPVKGRLSAAEAFAKHNDRNAIRATTAHKYTVLLKKFDTLGPIAFRAWLVSKIPAMQQTQGEWHPPMVEAAE